MASKVHIEAVPRRLLYSWLLVIWAIFGVFWALPLGQADIFPQDVQFEKSKYKGPICPSVDIRNSGEMLDTLTHCRVVEGYVQILLFDNVNSSMFDNISFPKLREITGHLLLYRVSGLRSVGKLFPNLTIIRGQELLLEHSLIIFEMPSLEEINLHSLMYINKGLIRIDKNPQLCFVNTINWKAIASIPNGHFIKSTKSPNECARCPQGCDYCWNNVHCQVICPKNNNSLCADDCWNVNTTSPENCTLCTNFNIDKKGSPRCMNKCPDEFFKYLGRRCLSRDECTHLEKYVEHSNTNAKIEIPYKVFNKSCIAKCPPDYTEDLQNMTCKRCDDNKCKKVCPGVTIDNLESAMQLKGCTHVNGSIEIEIRGGNNIVQGLEEHLGVIEEIYGYLKIVRSYPLISLSFFRKLRIIHGDIQESQRYALFVLDNQNLQYIWNWTTESNENRTFQIKNGTLFFHFNPKLCYNKILELQEKVNVTFNNLDVDQHSNGDKIACEIVTLELNVGLKGSKSINLTWTTFNITDSRKLLSYQIYHREAPNENITMYDNRDACGGDGWSIQDVDIPHDHQARKEMTAVIVDLKPFTTYAVYVKTYTIAMEEHGGQTVIRYFKTYPDQPTQPTDLKTTSNTSSSIHVSWGPPTTPNGELAYYLVTVIYKQKTFGGGMDFCTVRQAQTMAKPQTDERSTEVQTSPNGTCECANKKTAQSRYKSSKNEIDTESQINFENDLQNRIYIKRIVLPTASDTANSRKRRQLLPNNHNQNNESSFGENGLYRAVYTTTDTSLYITNLKHYTEYEINVNACRKKVDDRGDMNPYCSSPRSLKKTTLHKFGADNIISGVSLVRTTVNSLTLKWDPPEQPNGFVRAYRILYNRSYTLHPDEKCINHLDFERDNYMYTIQDLGPGNYSIKVLAISDAVHGGEYTIPIYALIEEPSNLTNLTIGIVLLFLVLIGMGVYLLFRRHRRDDSPRMNPSINPEYMYVPDDWEIPRKKIELHKELGQGSFGMVYEGIVREIKGKAQIRCAIKTVNEHATNGERLNFLKEASVMKAFDTAHVIKLLGVVSQGQPTLVIMELMANGDLKSYLRSHRPDMDGYTHGIIRQPPSLKRILQMAIEIADGMAYLSAKKFVHRDLAARNCMVAEDLTVKIGDFGMTRDIYETDYYRKGTKGLLPVRWMAPESLKDGVFSTSSDIWSYGVVLWEMATLASQPYQGLSNDQVLRYVIDGGIMERAENCPDKLYMLMMQCWKYKYMERPSFLDLCAILLEDANPQFSRISFYHSAAGMEARSARNNQLIIQDDVTMPLRLTKDYDEHFPLHSCADDSDAEDGLVGTSHIEFSSYPKVQKDTPATANGYVGANASNGTRA